MEFIVKTNLETELPKAIDFNFDALKNELTKRIENYKSLVVTKESIKLAKEDKASLNTLKKALEDKRISIKKEMLAPYNVFDAKVKELVAMIDVPVKEIDKQLIVFEDMRKEEKRAEITEIYSSLIGDRGKVLPLERLFNERWLNVTYSIKSIETDIQDLITRYDSDMAVLDSVESEFSEVVKIKYLDSLDLGIALKERAKLQLQAETLRQRERDAAERKEREEQERNAFREQTRSKIDPPRITPVEITPVEESVLPETEKVYTLSFTCNVTVAQAQALHNWLQKEGIEYRRNA